MEPRIIRMITILLVFLTALVMFTIAFATLNYVEVKAISQAMLCADYRYGLFKYCVADCGSEEESCYDINYKDLTGEGDDLDTGTYAHLMIFAYVMSCLTMCLCIVPTFITVVNKYYLPVMMLAYGVTGFLGIAFAALYTSSITDGWEKVHDLQEVHASTSWSFIINVIANILMIVSAGISVFILHRYPDPDRSYESQ